MSNLIGRKKEKEVLKEIKESSHSELVAIYGRRRVGKTFLVREFFANDIVFDVTGMFSGKMHDQLQNFNKELNKSNKRKKKSIDVPKSWFQAFSQLESYLDTLKSKKKKVVFIDEFPWIATAKSKFLMSFENFWNSYCTKRNDLIIIICGSAASYMVKNIIKSKGGLHNRITRKIRLLPFNLKETELFLKSRGFKYTKYDIIQLYMAIGGVPHYLEKLKKGNSIAQNIDLLCFEKDGVLNNEFNQLYKSLFKNSEKHILIINTLSKVNKGLSRKELINKSKIPSGGDFSLKLDELIESGFVSRYSYYQNKKQLTLYRLSDEYSKFYLKFISKNKNGGTGTWQRLHQSQAFNSWSGFVFETLCLKHIQQIKRALRIDAIYSTNSSWFNNNAQVDLLIDRDDNIINLCEMKFHKTEFTINKKYYQNLKNKITEFQNYTNTKKNIFITMISTYGVKQNQYYNELVENDLKMDILFVE